MSAEPSPDSFFPQLQPLDEHNRRLVENVHPSDWQNPIPTGRYNLVVVGGGTAGLVTAAGAAGLGAKVALIEKSLLGGDCLNVGCVPSKALLRCARAAADVRDAGQFGVVVPGPATVDFAAVMERMRRLRADFAPHDSAQRFRELGVDVYLGDARFTGPRTVEVAAQTLTFAKACIATGARPVTPQIPGLQAAGVLTNETVFSLTTLPRRLVVLGGGPIGCELAQAFARFGSQVSVIVRSGQLLGREDADAAVIVQRAMQRDGVEFSFRTALIEVRTAGTEKRLMVQTADGSRREIPADAILVGAGRTPNIDGLGLEAAGVAFDRETGVRVNAWLQTTNPHIFAAGDVCFPHKFTHTADALARIVVQNALFFGRAKATTLTIPWCTYTDPEVAHVGLGPKQAKEAGVAVDTIVVEMAKVDRAVLDGETDGFLKVHLKRGTDRIVGATLVARHAGDMISEVTLAITAGVGLRRIAATIHPYPTQAEVLKKAADAYNRTRLTPGVKRWLTRFSKWCR